MFPQPSQTHEFLTGIPGRRFVTQQTPPFPVHFACRKAFGEFTLREPLGQVWRRLCSHVRDEAVHSSRMGFQVVTPGRRLLSTLLCDLACVPTWGVGEVQEMELECQRGHQASVFSEMLLEYGFLICAKLPFKLSQPSVKDFLCIVCKPEIISALHYATLTRDFHALHVRPFRRFPVQCSINTTPVHSKAKIPCGTYRVPAGGSLAICLCDQGKSSR